MSLYKKIIHVSNMFYNEGLDKAGVRDLSGAIISLRQSLKFNKNNIEARNLLGLVYFEMGEVVAALSEWVISKNMRTDKNIADDYIEMIQANSSRLDSINATIKKYNQALTYCRQESKDLAVIQLKKVLSLNSRFVRAHQLLALLYIESEQWERAKRELDKCMDIDRNNILTLRYLREVEEVLTPDETVRSQGKRRNDDSVRYSSDNEIIIQPLNVKESKGGGVSSLLNIGLGLVIGIAVTYLLVVPAKIANVNNDAKEKITEIGNQLDAKTSRITELEAGLQELQTDNDNLHKELDGYVGTDGTLTTIDNLLSAATAYLQTQDIQQAAANLEAIAQSINIEETSEAFKGLYQTLLSTIGPQLAQAYYGEGDTAYKGENFELAIEKLTKAVYYDPANGDALFNLANAYRRSGKNAEAITYYDKVIEQFPDTERARKSQKYKDDLS